LDLGIFVDVMYQKRLLTDFKNNYSCWTNGVNVHLHYSIIDYNPLCNFDANTY